MFCTPFLGLSANEKNLNLTRNHLKLYSRFLLYPEISTAIYLSQISRDLLNSASWSGQSMANFGDRGGHIIQFIPPRGSVLTFFSREGGIRNYTPNGWEVLTALNSIKLPLWKKECMGFISLSKSSSILIHINVKKSLFQKLALQSPVENTLSQGELERRQEVKNAVRKIVRIIISDVKSYTNYDSCFQPTHLLAVSYECIPGSDHHSPREVSLARLDSTCSQCDPFVQLRQSSNISLYNTFIK